MHCPCPENWCILVVTQKSCPEIWKHCPCNVKTYKNPPKKVDSWSPWCITVKYRKNSSKLHAYMATNHLGCFLTNVAPRCLSRVTSMNYKLKVYPLLPPFLCIFFSLTLPICIKKHVCQCIYLYSSLSLSISINIYINIIRTQIIIRFYKSSSTQRHRSQRTAATRSRDRCRSFRSTRGVFGVLRHRERPHPQFGRSRGSQRLKEQRMKSQKYIWRSSEIADFNIQVHFWFGKLYVFLEKSDFQSVGRFLSGIFDKLHQRTERPDLTLELSDGLHFGGSNVFLGNKSAAYLWNRNGTNGPMVFGCMAWYQCIILDWTFALGYSHHCWKSCRQSAWHIWSLFIEKLGNTPCGHDESVVVF